MPGRWWSPGHFFLAAPMCVLAKRKKDLAKPSPFLNQWSARKDSNLRPLAPHASALPGCATRRRERYCMTNNPLLLANCGFFRKQGPEPPPSNGFSVAKPGCRAQPIGSAAGAPQHAWHGSQGFPCRPRFREVCPLAIIADSIFSARSAFILCGLDARCLSY